MEAASIKQLKEELARRSPQEVSKLVLDMAKYKKENKELLTYFLFEADDESSYIQSTKEEIDLAFDQVNTMTGYFIRKGIRKVLRLVKKHIRYSKKKQTEVELLFHFCRRMGEFRPSLKRSTVMRDLRDRQLGMAERAMKKLHEDLQYDYETELEELREW